VLNKEEWRKMRAKYSLPHPRKDEETSVNTIPFFSFLQRSCIPNGISKPKRGDIVVGRISRSLPSMLAPALMLELRGGYVGRCCICELEDPDEWTNMPLGHLNTYPKDEDDGYSDMR